MNFSSSLRSSQPLTFFRFVAGVITFLTDSKKPSPSLSGLKNGLSLFALTSLLLSKNFLQNLVILPPSLPSFHFLSTISFTSFLFTLTFTHTPLIDFPSASVNLRTLVVTGEGRGEIRAPEGMQKGIKSEPELEPSQEKVVFKVEGSKRLELMKDDDVIDEASTS